MEQKYDQDDWKFIVGIHTKLGCNVSETLRTVRTKYPKYAHLARKTFEEYLDSEDGKKTLAEALEFNAAEVEAELARNREKWKPMSLYRLWEACARELLMLALAGDRDAVRKALQYLRLGNTMLKTVQFDQHLEEEGGEMGMLMPGMQHLVAQSVRPCGAGVPPAPALSAGKMPAPPLSAGKMPAPQIQAAQNCGAGVPACAPAAAQKPQFSSTATLAGILACAAACTPASPSAIARKITVPASAQSTNHSSERLLATDKHR
ncbi:MAG: hypothetical protein ABSE73_20830 [Planctomycetota bacterium]